MRRIACSGIYRSGSTWIFNVCRLSCPNDRVFKLHPPSDEEYDLVFTSHRDLRRIAASLWRKYGGEPDYSWENSWKEIGECVSFHDFWSTHRKTVLDLKFEWLMDNKPAAFDLVRSLLGATENRDKIWNELEALKLPALPNKLDPVSQLHWNHITSNDPMSLAPLTKIEAEAIHQRFLEWQEAHGYGGEA